MRTMGSIGCERTVITRRMNRTGMEKSFFPHGVWFTAPPRRFAPWAVAGRGLFPALAKAACREAAGRFVQQNPFLEQHHPGASRHPSSSRRGKRFSSISLHWDSVSSSIVRQALGKRFSSISLHWNSSASTRRHLSCFLVLRLFEEGENGGAKGRGEPIYASSVSGRSR